MKLPAKNFLKLPETLDWKAHPAEIGVITEEIVVARGNVVDEILSEAQTRGCELIIMGYHVRGKFGEAVLGSTTRRLLRRSKIPVMLMQLIADDGYTR